jgi:ABC-type phosphate/phosphonate transport system substrate-binding protein
MYDRPELAAAHDRYWAHIRDAIHDLGGSAPQTLDRAARVWDTWRASDLVLSQTCGLPFATELEGDVALVGTPDYGHQGDPPGFYHSVIIVRSEDRKLGVTDFANRILAINEPGSQSGWAAAHDFGTTHGFAFQKVVETGAHTASVKAVQSGRADTAFIDAMTWRLVTRFDAPIGLHALARTPATPSLPYITAKSHNAGKIAKAVRRAIDQLSADDKNMLRLTALVDIPKSKYLAYTAPEAPNLLRV